MDRKSTFGGAKTPLNHYKNRVDARQSVNKASLAADARSSIVGGATSIGYRQSVAPGVTNKRIVQVPKILNIKEERNLRDKDVKQAIISKIINFLDDCVDPQPQFKFTEKNFLYSPSRNDFKNVFEFLFRCIQPNYQVNKLDEEVLKLMNNLGYPYNLKTYTMQQMTVPTTWPIMLTILEWLVDIIELENSIHNNFQNKDGIFLGSKWELFTTCYKRLAETKGNAQKELLKFEREFEIYRDSKIYNDNSDSFDELRAEMSNFDEKINAIRASMTNEKDEIAKLEEDIADNNADITSMNKYCEDLTIKISQIEQTLLDFNEINKRLIEKVNKLQEENLAKEQLISTQQISGERARQLTNERQSIREELSTIRNRLTQAEDKLYREQPKFYKQSAKVRSDYKTLISKLRSFYDFLPHSMQIKAQIATFFEERYDFEKAFGEIQELGIDNKLTQLMNQLKEFADQQIAGFKRSGESAENTKDSILKEIHELEKMNDQEQTKRKLEIDRAKRKRDDKLRPARDLKHNLDIIKQKRMATSEHLNKNASKLNALHEELAEKQKKYVNYKQQLDRQFNELQCQILDKITKLYERFEQNQHHKERLMELGNQILKENSNRS